MRKDFFLVCLSLALLVLSLGVVMQTKDVFWPTLLACLIGLSGLLFLLRQQETASSAREKEEAALERLKQEVHAASLHSSALEAQVINGTKEKQELSLEISSYQRKEMAFQHALEDAQNQLLKYKYEMNEVRSSAIVPQEEEEDKSVQLLYAQLKEQFEEKSEVLNQTRKELFALESTLFSLQKENEERACSDDETISDMQKLYAEYEDMQTQVVQLQELVSVLIQPKKSITPRKRKNVKEAQEDLLDLLKPY